MLTFNFNITLQIKRVLKVKKYIHISVFFFFYVKIHFIVLHIKKPPQISIITNIFRNNYKSLIAIYTLSINLSKQKCNKTEQGIYQLKYCIFE